MTKGRTIKEWNELESECERLRAMPPADLKSVLAYEAGQAAAEAESATLRAQLEAVRGLSRWAMNPGGSCDFEHCAAEMIEDSAGDYVDYLDIESALAAAPEPKPCGECAAKETALKAVRDRLGDHHLISCMGNDCAYCQLRVLATPPAEQPESEGSAITDAMHEAGFTHLWYAHPGDEKRPSRWMAGVWTDRDIDLLCVKICKTDDEAERWLSPHADTPLAAIAAAKGLRDGD